MTQFRVLYTDATLPSKQAESTLSAAGLDFQRIFIEDPAREHKTPPQLLTSEGFFPTIEDIRWYARVYGSGSDSH